VQNCVVKGIDSTPMISFSPVLTQAQKVAPE
jgi:hypothetical protein